MTSAPTSASSPLGYAAAAGACAAATAVATPLLGHVDLANIALIFMLAVVVSAARWGRGAGVFAAFLAVACFDFFFVPPRFSFTVAHAQYLITFAVMLVVSLVISHLTSAFREMAAEADRRASEAAFLHGLAAELAGAPNLEEVARRLAETSLRLLGVRAMLFLPGPDGQVAVFDPLHAHVDLAERVAAQGVYASGITPAANPDLHDHMTTQLVPLEGATRRRGVLGLHAGEAALAPDAALAQAVAALVATAIERIHFVDVAQASQLDMQSERLRNSILSTLSHDLRTPLTVLYGLGDTLAMRDDLPADARATAAIVREQGLRLHRMVDNLLDLARLRSGRVVLRRDWQAMSELVAASVRSMAYCLDSARLRLDVADDLPLIEVDALLFERVLCNLLENAVKFSPPGSPIEVAAHVEAGGTGAAMILVVGNDGPGFPAPDPARVFDGFDHGDAGSRPPGRGIGLAVCKAIVEAHGGTIDSSNRPGGAQVRVVLPLSEAPPVAAETAEEDEREERGKGANHG